VEPPPTASPIAPPRPLAPTTPAPAPPAPAPPPRSPRSVRLGPRWRRRLARAAEIALFAALLTALGLHCSVPDTTRLAAENPTTTAFIDLRRSAAEDAGEKFELRWQWRSLSAISRYLRAAVIYAEDYNFYTHDGVDWGAIGNAVSADWNRGAMSIGGSTITQQLAKNLYLSPSRSVLRKAREMLIAFALEDHLSKQRILELYLNVVEWGDGIFGAEAASRAWFHHGAAALSPAEAVRLAVALPNPFKRAPNVRDPDLTRKCVRLIRLLRMQGLLDASQERTALDEVGAPDERVLPGRAVATPEPTAAPSPTASSAPPTAASPAAPPAEAPHAEPPPPVAPSEPPPSEPPPSEPSPSEPSPEPSPADNR
jgi:monofunctional biosynthetic peptidoglycan transglycosylase